MQGKMFIIDDVLLRTAGFSIPPFDMLWLLETIRDFIEQQRFNLVEISDKLKENRMLFEFGEIEKETYEKVEKMLLKRREEALKVKQHITQTHDVAL